MELNNKQMDDIVKSKRDHIYIDESDRQKYKIVDEKLPFDNNLHIFAVATFIGYYYDGDPKPIKDKYNGFVHLSVFSKSPYLDYLKTFAVVHEKDPLVLVDEKRLYSICEGYARTGIGLLVDWIDSKEEDLDNIIAKCLTKKFNELNVE